MPTPSWRNQLFKDGKTDRGWSLGDNVNLATGQGDLEANPLQMAVAYYASHGTSDSVLNYSNGVGLFQNFAKANGCTYVTPTSVTSGNHVCSTLTGCMTGYPTEFCSFNGDHTPDPKDSGQSTSWEYQNVWTFLSQF